MATDSEIRALILEPMVKTFAPPYRVPDPQAKLEQYAYALRAYPAAALEGAWIAIRNNRTESSWPEIGEITKAVRDWVHNNVKPEPGVKREDGKQDVRYPDNAVRAMSTKDGQMALEHGYGRILYQHVERNGWLEGFDHAKAKALDTEMREQIAEMERNGDGFGGAILNMGKRRLDTEDQLKSKYLRRAAA